MKRTTIKIIGLAVILAMYYLVISLLGWEINVLRWNLTQKILYGFGCAMLVIYTMGGMKTNG